MGVPTCPECSTPMTTMSNMPDRLHCNKCCSDITKICCRTLESCKVGASAKEEVGNPKAKAPRKKKGVSFF